MTNVPSELLEYLGSHLTDNKRAKIQEVISLRTRHLTVLLEDLQQPHNASACLRSCDCFGLQDVHVVESLRPFTPDNQVSMGSFKWVSLHRHQRTEDAIHHLRERGYRFVATSPNEDGDDLASLPIDRPLALLFGNEAKGLSETALNASDYTLRLPMVGFTESLNISVALALVVSRLTERMRASTLSWQLSEDEKNELTLRFYRRVLGRYDLLEETFWAEQNRRP